MQVGGLICNCLDPGEVVALMLFVLGVGLMLYGVIRAFK